MLCSTDLDRSREFYEQKVGLTLSPRDDPEPFAVRRGRENDTARLRSPRSDQGDHTQVRLWSTDVAADVAELAARGVVFEDYDFPALKTVDHVATTAGVGKSAWFKDPDGNTLALFQPE